MERVEVIFSALRAKLLFELYFFRLLLNSHTVVSSVKVCMRTPRISASLWSRQTHSVSSHSKCHRIALPKRVIAVASQPHLDAHAHPLMAYACSPHFGLRMRISFWPKHAHLFLECTCASYFGCAQAHLILSAHAHLILVYARAFHFGLRIRISLWPAHEYLILACACASHFGLRMSISFKPAHVQLLLA